MARMSIDDAVGRDPRVIRLAKLCQWSRRETLGCLLDVWAICYDRVQVALSREDIETAAERDGFVDLLIQVGLASAQANKKIRLSGVNERIGYLIKQSEHGREGGRKSAESRRNSAKAPLKQASRVELSKPQGSRNPIAIVPDSAPDPVSVCAIVLEQPRKLAKARPKASHPIPENWSPRESEQIAASQSRLNCSSEASAFRDHHIAKGSHMADWDAAFRTWLRNAVKFSKASPVNGRQYTPASHRGPV